MPLQIDSTIPEVVEAALRVYNGKPIVNSVNGEEDSLNAILPMVKKYGAAVVGLTLDKNGIPPKAEQRFEIAERIVSRSCALGIPKEDIYIDCFTLRPSGTAADGRNVKAVKLKSAMRENRIGCVDISLVWPNRNH